MKNYEEHQKMELVISIFEKKWSGMIIKVLLEALYHKEKRKKETKK